MKTIADIKRKMIVGSVWHTLWQCREAVSDMGERKLLKVQSNCFGFESKKHLGECSWYDWPKKSEVVFISETAFRIIHGDIKLTYTLIN